MGIDRVKNKKFPNEHKTTHKSFQYPDVVKVIICCAMQTRF